MTEVNNYPSGPQVQAPKPVIWMPPPAKKWEREPEVKEIIQYFEHPEKRDNKSALTSKDWIIIEHETARCMDDFNYAARNYFWIVPEDKVDRLLSLKETQERILEEYYRLKSLGKPQKIQILKSRRLGCSTLIEAMIAWQAMFHVNTTAYVVSYDKDHAAELYSWMVHIYDRMPWWLKPMCSTMKVDEGLVFDNPNQDERATYPGLNSKVKVAAATQAYVGRGDRISAAHISEYAMYDPDIAKKMITADIRDAIHDNPDSFAFLESTGKGAGTFSHSFWRKNKKLGEDAEYSVLFFPWFFDRAHFIPPPQGWYVQPYEDKMRSRVLSEWTKCDHCRRFHETFHNNVRWDGSQCPRCKTGTLQPYELLDGQLRWMEQRRKQAEDDEEQLKILKQESCTSDEECWQVSGYQVFPQPVIDKATLCIRPPIAIGNIDRTGVFHGVRVINTNTQNFEIGSRCWQDGCAQDHRFEEESPLMIWEWPIPNCSYSVGVDIAEGIGKDYSVISVIRIGHGPNPDVLVALWRSNRIDPLSFAAPINMIGRWYNDALLAIEYNVYTSCGDEVRFRLQYPNLYRWTHMDSVSSVLSNKWHWYTNSKSKPKLWQTLTKRIRDETFFIHSSDAVEEMKFFKKEDFEGQSAGAEGEFHDDILMACMVALYVAHEQDTGPELPHISSRRDGGLQSDVEWDWKCPRCAHTWKGPPPTDSLKNPDDQDRCPECGFALIEATRSGLNAGVQDTVDFDEMSRLPVDAVGVGTEFDRL